MLIHAIYTLTSNQPTQHTVSLIINKCNTVCYLHVVSLAVFPAGSIASRTTNFLIKGNKQAHSSAGCEMQTQQLSARRVCVIFHCLILLLSGFKSSWLHGSHPGRSGERDFSASGVLKSIRHHYFFTGSNVWERLVFLLGCAELSGRRSVFKRHSVWWLPGVKFNVFSFTPIVFGFNSARALRVRKAISQLTTLLNEHWGIYSDVFIICHDCAQNETVRGKEKALSFGRFAYWAMLITGELSLP